MESEKNLKTHNSPQKGFAYLRSPHQKQKFNSVVNVQDNPQSRIRMKKPNMGHPPHPCRPAIYHEVYD